MARVKVDETITEHIAWLWHDAEIIALNTDFSIAWETTLTLRCTLHTDEPRDRLFALGITSATVDLSFQDIDTAQLQLHYKTGAQETLDSWVISDEQGQTKHHLTTHTGSVFVISAAELLLADVQVNKV